MSWKRCGVHESSGKNARRSIRYRDDPRDDKKVSGKDVAQLNPWKRCDTIDMSREKMRDNPKSQGKDVRNEGATEYSPEALWEYAIMYGKRCGTIEASGKD